MSSKRPKETRIFSSKNIETIQGHDTWITCILTSGERLNISLNALFGLLDKYDIETEKYGNRWRAISFLPRVPEALPQTGMPIPPPVNPDRLASFLNYVREMTIRGNAIGNLSGAFATAELEDFDDEYLYIVVTWGVTDIDESKSYTNNYSISILNFNLIQSNQELYVLLMQS